MGLWSRLKKAAKWVARKVKAAVRLVIRFVVTAVLAAINAFDLVFGFFNWPRKKLTLHVVILSKFDPVKKIYVPLCQPNDVRLRGSIDHVRRILSDRFNVGLRPYDDDYVQTLESEAPPKALKPSCCGADLLGQEFVSSGEFYAQHTAGWVGIPVSLDFPITVFVVEDVQCKAGCSNGPLADYIVIKTEGLDQANSNFLMMHEMGHACSLWHSWGESNIMYKEGNRGDGAKWFQSNLLRSSRHVTYW